jgi:hypothetical protein
MPIDFSAINEKQEINFSALGKEVDFSSLEKDEDSDVVESLPDTLQIAFWQTDIPLPPKVSAAIVGAGHMMTDIYRGVKQMAGIDEISMKREQKAMDDLYDDERVGGYAIGGAVVGALAEPIGLLIPAGKAKALTSVGKIGVKTALKATGKAVAKGAGVGATFGGLGYVAEEKGQTRLGNAALGGTIGGLFSGAIRGVGVRKYNKSVGAAEKRTDAVELLWAKKILEEKPHSIIRDEIVKELPNLKLKESAQLIGRRAKLVSTKAEALDVVNFFNNAAPKANDLVVGADKVSGVMSTRISNINEMAGDRLRKYDSNLSIKTHKNLNEVNIWLSDYNKISGKVKNQIDLALMNGDHKSAKALMKIHGGDKLVTEFNKVEKVLKDLGDELEGAGRITKLENYFPRFVQDKEGLFKQIGRVEQSRIEKALDSARRSTEGRGYALSPSEETQIINKALRGFPVEQYKPRFSKQRGIEQVKEDWLRFYSSPEEALHTYIRDSVTDLEKVRFFGRDIRFKESEGAKLFDIDASVGEFVRKEMTLGKLSRNQQKELENLLSIRFGIGERAPAGLMQDTKNIMYAGLLGNPVSAATQLGDLGVSIYSNGFLRTLRSLPKSLVGKTKVNAVDLGIIDSMAEVFATTRASSKFMRASMKWGLFNNVDRFGKNVYIDSVFSKYKSLAKKPKGVEKIREKYGHVFGDEFDEFVNELNNNKITDKVKHFLYSEVADVQPISLSEMPEMYLRLPNGRVAYMLKTFMLKQMDVVRRDSYNLIKSGKKAEGLSNLMKYGIVMGAGGATSKYIKDWMMGRDVAPDLPADIGENFLKMFAYNEYLGNKIKEGKVFEAATDIVIPPYEMFDKIANSAIEGDNKWTQYMPVWGRLWYNLYGGGLEEYQEKKDRRELKLDEE